jgi:hypothetical protein
MKYMLLIQQGDTPTPRDPEAWGKLSEDEQKAVFAAYGQINQTPGVTPGEQMDAPEAATTVRVQDGKTLTTDGPFVAVKEALGGYLFFEADDLDAAIELAAKIPAASMGGAIEVRPVVEGY